MKTQKISFRFTESNGLHSIDKMQFCASITTDECISKWWAKRVNQFAKMARPMPISLEETEVCYVG
tara:strand:+ start:1289 stop:1486 length:198 start_codon:yes stop_codon:yes gene_type:complete